MEETIRERGEGGDIGTPTLSKTLTKGEKPLDSNSKSSTYLNGRGRKRLTELPGFGRVWLSRRGGMIFGYGGFSSGNLSRGLFGLIFYNPENRFPINGHEK